MTTFPITREQIMQALFDLVSQSAEYTTVSRKFRLWSDVPMEERPALFMLERNEDNTGSERATPGVTTLNVDFFIYTNARDAEVPASILNPLLDALDVALKPPYDGARQTLGGIVCHTYTGGRIMKDTGDIDGDGIAIVPVKVRVNA